MTPDWTRYEAVVGKRWRYYAPRFERFSRGAWLSWNWAAFFGTLAWLRYRRLYVWSWPYFFVSAPALCLAYLVLVAFVDPCARAIAPEAYDPWFHALGTVAILVWVLPALLADRLYFAHVRALVDAGGDAVRAGTGSALWALVLQTLFVMFLIVSVPTHSGYLYRSRVTEALNAAGVLREPVEGYLRARAALPGRIDEIAAKTSTRNVREVTLAAGGALRATFSESAERLAGRSVQWEPRVEGHAVKAWTCRSVDLPDICLPRQCRKP